MSSRSYGLFAENFLIWSENVVKSGTEIVLRSNLDDDADRVEDGGLAVTLGGGAVTIVTDADAVSPLPLLLLPLPSLVMTAAVVIVGSSDLRVTPVRIGVSYSSAGESSPLFEPRYGLSFPYPYPCPYPKSYPKPFGFPLPSGWPWWYRCG